MNDQRFPLRVRLTGVMYKDADKRFLTVVLWSDESEIIIYRSFQEFKKLHKSLKRKLATESRFRKSERVLPRFPAKTITHNLQRKGPSRSMLRLKYMENYCTELLACGHNIVQSFEMIQFFTPQNHDLQPDYAKNSIVIMPSEDIGSQDTDYVDSKRLSFGNISQPFLSETYRCVAAYETKDTKNRPFSVAVNETVDVLIKDKGGWWLVENTEKHLAWFPAPYLESCEDDDEEDDLSECPMEGRLYCMARCYRATKEDEVSVNIGSVVEVLQKSADGWWFVRHKGNAGYVPSMYLRPYCNPHLRFQALQKDMRSSSLCLAQLHLQEAAPGLTPPKGDSLRPTFRPRSQSMELLSASPIRSITEEPATGKDCEGRPSVASEGSELSFSDDCGSLCGSSVSASCSDKEEQRPGSQAANSHGDQADGRKPSSTTSVPKVPPRPRVQEILSRCTTITRKAAQTYVASQLMEHGEREIC
ncbi:NADPH oxidase organizer 1b [Paramormyrops kingsleyae]|uniref:NADPH oxidase organizer 1b n=1 Tax=Paramormyrops kingsleyae TaxID=1676925 RepID=UPI003B96F4B9